MARGWESKNIESQQEDAGRARNRPPALTPEERAKRARRHSLELARARAAADLERATAPAHRSMLEQAIKTLDQQIGELANS
ncbi:MAG TPA: hypothetical protein VL484_18515 [Vicinamibacterales bacterium]|jgi:hypothetical protein|nr:hypothetical protein [Vicinamibacterales bacterium]